MARARAAGRLMCGRVFGRRLEQAGQHRGFRQVDVARRLVEVEMRRAVDAEGAAAHIGAVEIELQDLVLGQPRLQPDREERLLDLALDGALVAQEQVLRQLLGDRRTALAHAAGLRVGDQRARGAGDVDAEMVVEAAVLGGERRLDQIVRKILQRNRVVVLDAAAADRIAVAVEEGHREIGFLQPVVVGGFAKRRDRQRQHQDQAAEPDGGGFRQRLDEDPALPAADIEAVHEGRVALVELAQALAGREQRRVDARIEIQQHSAGSSSSTRLVRSGAPRPLVGSKALSARPGAVETSCGNVAANPRRFCAAWGLTPLSSRAGAINQWSRLAILIGRPNAVPGFFAPWSTARLRPGRCSP